MKEEEKGDSLPSFNNALNLQNRAPTEGQGLLAPFAEIQLMGDRRTPFDERNQPDYQYQNIPIQRTRLRTQQRAQNERQQDPSNRREIPRLQRGNPRMRLLSEVTQMCPLLDQNHREKNLMFNVLPQ